MRPVERDLVAVSVLVWLLACGQAEPASLSSGRHQLQLLPEAQQLILSRDGLPLLVFGPDAFELGTVGKLDPEASYDPHWLVYEDAIFKPQPPADLRWQGTTSMRILEADTARASLALELTQGHSARLELSAGAPDAFLMRVVPEVNTTPIAWIRVRPTVGPSEGFYGLGEWPDAAEHRGKLRPMQLEPALAWEGKSNENHVPVPLLIGTKGWGLFVESRRTGLFDVAKSAADRVEITFGTADESAAGLQVHLFGAEQPLDVTRLYYQVTGFPRRPAPWALGPWIWRDENRDQAEVEGDIAKIRDLDLATTAIWLDRPYASKVNTFDFEAARFPDPAGMLKLAHDHGLRVALWHVPYVEEGAEPFRSTAERDGYFPPSSGTQLNRWSAPLDLTNPAAYTFWQESLRRYTALGVEGWKLDYAEDVMAGIGGERTPWLFFDGSDERTMHLEYTRLYHRLYAETLPEDGGFMLCRAGRWGDQVNASVIWPGDMDANFARHGERFTGPSGDEVIAVGGLPATVIQGMGLGPSGFPLFGADTGGYRHSPPDRETFLRWVEQTALSPVMQVGDSSSEPPWVFTSTNGRDAATLDHYRSYARLHLRLFPYLWTYVVRLTRDGRALQRPTGLAYPELGQHPDGQYLLGDELLVAPVVERGGRTKRVHLPPGEWIDWWTGARAAGPGDIVVDAPLERLPLFLRAGGAVPMLRPTIDALAPTTLPDRVDSFASDAGPLYARIGLGARGHFELYDGTVIDVHERGAELQPGSVFLRVGRLELLGSSALPASVKVDGLEIPAVGAMPELEGATRGWYYDRDARLLSVALGDGPHKVEIIE